jgi:trypsin
LSLPNELTGNFFSKRKAFAMITSCRSLKERRYIYIGHLLFSSTAASLLYLMSRQRISCIFPETVRSLSSLILQFSSRRNYFQTNPSHLNNPRKMKFAAFFATTTLVSTAAADATPGAIRPLIVGGRISKAGDHPYLVGIRYDKETDNFCGGALISSKHVLTAAHCAMFSSDYVSVGSIYSKGTKTGKQIAVVKQILHPKYHIFDYKNDFQILELAEPVPKHIKPLRLVAPNEKNLVKEGATVQLMGWGRTQEKGNDSHVVRETEVTIFNTAQCQKIYKKYNLTVDGATMFCAYKKDTDSCQGDSGGPVVMKKDGEDVLVGVVSWGIGCARRNIPGVYATMSANLKFIYNNIPSLKPKQD